MKPITILSTRGFTLVEIVMAMMLLGVTGTSLLNVYSNSTAITDAPENVAYYLAAQQQASLHEAVRFDYWPTGTRPLGLTAPGPAPAAEVLAGRTYTPTYNVNDASGNPLPDRNGDGREDYRKARVRVSWP